MISITEKKKCSGCSACYSICPKRCISMKSDEEGFLYPVVDQSRCVDCRLCEKICPITGKDNKNIINAVKETYIVQNKDNDVLKESTSGGFFSALCSYIFENNGVVFGAAYDKNFRIIHTWIDDIKELHIFRNSKYAQSQVGDAFIECKKILDSNRLVCFSGTPCQIAGLKKYLQKDYDNLITVDIACHGVPSPLVFKKYVDWVGGGSILENIKFRDKQYGYYSSTMGIYYKNGKVKRREIHADPMLSFFFDNYCSRPTCYACEFKNVDRVSDYTMFDCWHANKYNPDFGDKGATAVIAHTSRAVKIIELLQKQFQICVSCRLEDLLYNDGKMLIESVPESKNREAFFKDIREVEFEDVLRRYHKRAIVEQIKMFIKALLMRTGLFSRFMYLKFKYR